MIKMQGTYGLIWKYRAWHNIRRTELFLWALMVCPMMIIQIIRIIGASCFREIPIRQFLTGCKTTREALKRCRNSLHGRIFLRTLTAVMSGYGLKGYTLNMGYAYNDIYSSVVNYFDAELFSSDIVDLNELDRRLVNLSIFNSALYKKKMDLEYIEVAPKILISISQVEYVYGITISDVKKLQEWVLKCEDKYFNAHSLWNRLSESGFSEKLQNNEWMCTCIFRQQEAIASLQVAGGIILCREYSELNFGLICKWLVEKNGRMTIQNLASLFNDTFSTRVPVTKIAEKMKAYGLWETFVTDSFEEYIDNLVVNTDLELDDNDLFQEEFF